MIFELRLRELEEWERQILNKYSLSPLGAKAKGGARTPEPPTPIIDLPSPLSYLGTLTPKKKFPSPKYIDIFFNFTPTPF